MQPGGCVGAVGFGFCVLVLVGDRRIWGFLCFLEMRMSVSECQQGESSSTASCPEHSHSSWARLKTHQGSTQSVLCAAPSGLRPPGSLLTHTPPAAEGEPPQPRSEPPSTVTAQERNLGGKGALKGNPWEVPLPGEEHKRIRSLEEHLQPGCTAADRKAPTAMFHLFQAWGNKSH